MKNYWAHDGTRIDWHDTKREAITAAQDALDAYKDAASGGWGHGVGNVSWGAVLGYAVEYNKRPAESSSALDFLSDYELRETKEPRE